MTEPAIDILINTLTLNDDFLDMYRELDSNEITRPRGKERLGAKGILQSVNAAKTDAHWMIIHYPEFIDMFELVGTSNQIAPALLAGISSRETDFGKTILKYNGWGDYRKTLKYKKKIYHNFCRAISPMQIDIFTGPISKKMQTDLIAAQITKEPKFDPYGIEWVQIAAQDLNTMKITARKHGPQSTPAIQLATAVSYYNSGPSNPEIYPKSDNFTAKYTFDYANDTLVRAKYLAENWNDIVKQAKQYNQFPKK